MTHDLQIGKVYKLKYGAYGSGRWGSEFKIKKITEMNVICGFWISQSVPMQHGCIKVDKFKEMIE